MLVYNSLRRRVFCPVIRGFHHRQLQACAFSKQNNVSTFSNGQRGANRNIKDRRLNVRKQEPQGSGSYVKETQESHLSPIRKQLNNLADAEHKKHSNLELGERNWNALADFTLFETEVLPLSKDMKGAYKFLKSLLDQKIKPNDFESKYFKNYNYLMSHIYDFINDSAPNRVEIDDLVNLFHIQSRLYFTLGKIQSSKLTLLQKRLLKEISTNLNSLSSYLMYKFIEALSNFDLKPSFTMTQIDRNLLHLTRDLDSKVLPNLLKYLVKLNYKNEGAIEIITEKIFKNLSLY